MDEMFIYLGIAFCITQSATFSGLNLAVFSLSRLRLETAAERGDPKAAKVLSLRQDANYTLVTILWGNVAINVLLTLLAESVLAGVAAFVFSTVVITFVGEIIPQAYFSRHALRVAAFLAPLLRFYQVLLWPVARPVGKLLDFWVGPEGVPWLREHELEEILYHHAHRASTEVGALEATGAINFLALDDLPVRREGELLDPVSVIRLPVQSGHPVFPPFERSPEDPFMRYVAASGKKWIVITEISGEPRFVLNAHMFIREALFGEDPFVPVSMCHRPLIVRDGEVTLDQVLGRLRVRPEHPGDDVVDEDLVLVWTENEKRIITGSDLLGRLLRGIVWNPAIQKQRLPARRP